MRATRPMMRSLRRMAALTEEEPMSRARTIMRGGSIRAGARYRRLKPRGLAGRAGRLFLGDGFGGRGDVHVELRGFGSGRDELRRLLIQDVLDVAAEQFADGRGGGDGAAGTMGGV